MDDLVGVLTGPVLLIVLVCLALGWYLSYLAGRLDRLHHRVESARTALQARLAARAVIAREAGRLLGTPEGGAVMVAATRTLAGPVVEPVIDPRPGPAAESEPQVREALENELSRALHRAFADPAVAEHLRRGNAEAEEVLAELIGAGDRVQLARRFHNDAVAHTQRMRRKRVVRWARLAGRARMPQMLEIDDSPPAGLGWDA